jgi:cell division protease FtsH
VVDRPDVAGRRQILDVHTRDKPLHPNVRLDTLAKRTPGFSGADLANLANEAALLAARRNLRQIGMRECEEAIDRVMAGPERKTLVMSEHDKLVTAYHEGGHVLVGHVLSHADPIHKVSIVARSRSLGLTFTLPEDKYNHSRSELRDAMAMCLGGRSAEELVFVEPTTGAENDIDKATRIARAMVTEYGMSDLVGLQALRPLSGEAAFGDAQSSHAKYSEHTAGLVDAEVRGLLDAAHQRALAILSEHRAVLDELARELVEHETLEGPDLMAIIGHLDGWPEIPASSPPASSPASTRAAKPAAPRPGPAAARKSAPAVKAPSALRRTRAVKPAPAAEPAQAVKPAPANKPASAGRVRPRPRPQTSE